MRFRPVRLGAATSKRRDLGGVTRKFLARTVWDASRRRKASLPCLAGWGYCAGSARGCCRVVLRGQNDVTPARYQRITSERLARKYEIGKVSQHVECAASHRLRKGARSGRLSSSPEGRQVRAPLIACAVASGQGARSGHRVRAPGQETEMCCGIGRCRSTFHRRKRWDSNPRYGVTAQRFSRPSPSAARTRFPRFDARRTRPAQRELSQNSFSQSREQLPIARAG